MQPSLLATTTRTTPGEQQQLVRDANMTTVHVGTSEVSWCCYTCHIVWLATCAYGMPCLKQAPLAWQRVPSLVTSYRVRLLLLCRTILNSWGTGRDKGQLRTSGITGDGLFRIKMGLSGIGTPDATFGISCYPTNGTTANLHSHTPWTRNIRRFLTPLEGINGRCYNYTIRKGDTLAAIVDHFELDMRQVGGRC
jgi:hypothetical protein